MPTRSFPNRFLKRLPLAIALILSLGAGAGAEARSIPSTRAHHRTDGCETRAHTRRTSNAKPTAKRSEACAADARRAAQKQAARERAARERAAEHKKAKGKHKGKGKGAGNGAAGTSVTVTLPTSTTGHAGNSTAPGGTTTPGSTTTPSRTTTPGSAATSGSSATSGSATTPASSTSSGNQVTAPAPPSSTTTTSTPSPPASGSSPVTSSTDPFYVYPSDSAVTEENALTSQGQTAEAAQIEKIAREPEAIWLTYDGSQSVVPGIMSAARNSGTIPIFVVYNIPLRDCGSYSAGGASSPSDYESFVDSIVSDLGQGKAMVIVEPDALSEMSCQSSAEQQTYYQLIGYAAQHLDEDANASVYVDAGNPGWQSASTEAARLNQALGSTRAGFAINVSNFDSTATDISYGTQISQATGGRHFVIDTSRNGGTVASGQWCNPSGAGIGADPTTDTGNSLVDADVWIKDVGDSDGQCNGGPSAGQFWLSYALALVANG
jgi:endoglucanase